MVELEDSENFSLEEAEGAVEVNDPVSFAQAVKRLFEDCLMFEAQRYHQDPRISYELLRKKPHLYSRVSIGPHKVLVYRLNWLKETQDGM